jgi:hypothetical protein
MNGAKRPSLEDMPDADYARVLERAHRKLANVTEVASPPGMQVVWKLPVRLFVSKRGARGAR